MDLYGAFPFFIWRSSHWWMIDVLIGKRKRAANVDETLGKGSPEAEEREGKLPSKGEQ